MTDGDEGAAVASAGAPAVLRRRFSMFADSPHEYSERAVRLVESTVVVDMLNQFRFPDAGLQPPLCERWLRKPGTFTADDWQEYHTSGFRVFGLGGGDKGYDGALTETSEWNGFVAEYPDWFMRVSSGGDFQRLALNGKLGILITMQNADHFRTVDDVDLFWGLGQRVSQLTYNRTNRLGSGFLADTDAGLTDYGTQIIARMEQVGMAVDLSHAGDRTTRDALAVVKKAPIVSHAAARAAVPGHLRAKPDDVIEQVAKLGGVIGIPMIRFMIKLDEPVTIEHVLDHFDHVARLVGAEHVGIGGDLDLIGNANPVNSATETQIVPNSQPNFDRYHFHAGPDGKLAVPGLDHSKRMYDLAEGLIRRKYSDADIGLMFGGNWQRVLSSIWGG
ncbi:MAG TPA: membrane dipeptidase [Gemmatimonadaceae bacterium]|jgi:membrane dipeptidase|nr:membrane dipeptidase [Gemmatimonadaceae bacterium]